MYMSCLFSDDNYPDPVLIVMSHFQIIYPSGERESLEHG